jgi:hypothetical protein
VASRGTVVHANGTEEKLQCDEADMAWAWDELANYATEYAGDGEWNANKGQRAALLLLGDRIRKRLDKGHVPEVG